jgi:hypothetical protein
VVAVVVAETPLEQAAQQQLVVVLVRPVVVWLELQILEAVAEAAVAVATAETAVLDLLSFATQQPLQLLLEQV